ncbi:MAG: hypothetical protein OQL06_15750 [Gammaproteobacteria bacterium]|nr:hypothetical protein [Gammaproteobacteria bacterium]
MNTKLRFIFAMIAAMFASSVLFSGSASAGCNHEYQEPTDITDSDYYD